MKIAAGAAVSLFGLRGILAIMDGLGRHKEADNTSGVPCAALDEIADIYRFVPVGMGLFSLDYYYLRVNERMAEFNGIPAEQHINRTIFEVVPDVAHITKARIDEVREARAALPRRIIDRQNPVTGDLNSYAVHWYPVFGTDGEVQAVGVIAEDITTERQHEKMLQHIARELQHRVRNTLANVVALVDQATRSTRGPAQTLSVLKSRIGALAKTHGRLTETNWGPTSLLALLRQELSEVYGTDAVTLEGEDLMMTAQTALAFSMALHEMAANAMHYGALAKAGGHIAVHWNTAVSDDGRDLLCFNWKESGGLTPQDDRVAGFGTRLIDASIKTSLNGNIDRHWEEDGLRYQFAIPLKLIRGG